MSGPKKHRGFCWAHFDEEHAPEYDESKMRYMCYAPEICPESGRFHWQTYVYFKSAKTLSAAAKVFKKQHGFGTKLKKCDGSAKENRGYIKGPYGKDGKEKPINPDFVEFGDMPEQGARRDLNELKDKIMEGAWVDDIVLDTPMMFHKYGRTLERMETIRLRNNWRTEMTTCDWYWGETSKGKSHRYHNYQGKAYNPKDYFSVTLSDNGWWDGYKQQDTVIFNDFKGEISYGMLMRFVDKWPVSVRRRNSEPIPFVSKHIIISSSRPPWSVYEEYVDDEFVRRINVVEVTER